MTHILCHFSYSVYFPCFVDYVGHISTNLPIWLSFLGDLLLVHSISPFPFSLLPSSVPHSNCSQPFSYLWGCFSSVWCHCCLDHLCVCVILFRRRSIDAVELFISLLPFVLCLPFGKRNLLFFFLPQLVFFFLLLFRVFSHLRWTGNLLPFVSPQLFRRPKTFTMKRGCVIHKPSIRRPTIQNVVATVSVGQAIDLRLIREKARNAEYNPRVRDS